MALGALQKLPLTDLEVFFFFSQNLCSQSITINTVGKKGKKRRKYMFCLQCPLYDFLVNLEYILPKPANYFLLLFIAWGAQKNTHSH